MNTKIVYAIVSSGKSVYFERAFVSAWSVKHYNPQSKITVVIDYVSRNSVDSECYVNFMKLIDEEIVISINDDYTNVEKSRWIKTNLRNLVKGDFLFLDVDTIVCEDLSEIDDFDIDIGFVQDFNCPFRENQNYKIHKRLMKKYFNQTITSDSDYFNSGVIFAKDKKRCHDFFTLWHNNWLETRRNGYFRDQLSLLKTTIDSHGTASEISGVYNCQFCINLKFLHQAKIMHFYRMQKDFSLSPFFDESLYLKVRENKEISEELQSMILNCKSIFNGPSMSLGGIDLEIVGSNVYRLIKNIFNNHTCFLFVLKGICNSYYKVFK